MWSAYIPNTAFTEAVYLLWSFTSMLVNHQRICQLMASNVLQLHIHRVQVFMKVTVALYIWIYCSFFCVYKTIAVVNIERKVCVLTNNSQFVTVFISHKSSSLVAWSTMLRSRECIPIKKNRVPSSWKNWKYQGI